MSWPANIMHRCGHGGNKKALFVTFMGHIVMLAIYNLRYGYFCAHDDDNDDDMIDYFTPCTCTRGNNVMNHAVSVRGVSRIY